MKLVFRQECQPTDTVTLIGSQVGFDGDRHLIWLNFAIVEELLQEFSLGLSLRQQPGRKPFWIRNALLQTDP